MSVSIPRLTFRIHDNPLLLDSNAVIVLIQKDRLPVDIELYNEVFLKNHNWGYHQYSLLLQTIKNHKKDLDIELITCYVSLSDIPELLDSLSKAGITNIKTDYVSDPVYKQMNSELSKSGISIETYNTFTMLDWRSESESSVLINYFKKAKPFSKLKPLKEHIKSKSSQIKTTKSFPTGKRIDLSRTLSKWSIDIDFELEKTWSKMRSIGMKVHKFNLGEKQLMEYTKYAISLIDTNTWTKPKTAIGLEWGLKTTMKNKNSSQLSPYFAIGAISVKYVWNQIKSSNSGMGSARDQLLFRECFNAIAIGADSIKASGTRLAHFWSNDINSPFIDPKASNYKWKNDEIIINNWKIGNISGDAGESMKLLWKNGWIHHLRRHLVADTLTRGKFHQMWTHGMHWFRYTLLDHDTAVNRCNWMWLSAIAFSSKQKVYHYGENYVTRNTPKSLNPIKRTFKFGDS